jgi:hypothetical protein
MKSIKYLLFCGIFYIAGCTVEMKDYTATPDKTAPGIVSNVSETPSPGGITFHYTLPDDDDLMCVKAVYVDDRGMPCEMRASWYVDSLTIEGFGNTEPKTVRLIVVDNSKNESAPVERTVTPGEPVIYGIAESVVAYPYWGGVQLVWNNPSHTDIAIELYMKDFTDKYIPLDAFYGNAEWGTGVNFSGLKPVETEFGYCVRDRWGNKSPVKYFALTPDPSLLTPNFAGKVGMYVERFNDDSRLTALDKVTYETWVKFDKWSDVDNNIQSLMGNEHGTEGFQLRIRFSGDLQLTFLDGKGFAVAGLCPLNQWIHIAAVYDGATIKLYMNFMEVGSNNVPNRLVNLSQHHANDVAFGVGQSFGTRRYLFGLMRETRVWSTARTVDELTANQCEVDPATPGLIAYWKFNEGEGNVFKDSSPNQFDLQTETPFNWELTPGCGY